MAPRANRDHHQVAAVLAPEDFDTVQGMSEALELSKAEVVRRLVTQGITALRAAAAADDAGEDRDAAVVLAMRETVAATEVTKHLLDVVNDHLERVARRSWRDATLLASGASKALRGWADQQATTHGTTLAEMGY